MTTSNVPIPPGSTIGIVGGGQLGRMLAMAAVQIGYVVHVYAPEESGPARDAATRWVRGGFGDAAGLSAFARDCAVVTFEFENIPASTLAALANHAAVWPPARALEIGQDRAAEKAFAQSLGIPVAPFALVTDDASLTDAVARVGVPSILKTNRLGYDGKGQVRLTNAADAAAAFDAVGRVPAVLEAFVDFAHEFSVLLVRTQAGDVQFWESPENRHVDGILAQSHVPGSALVAGQVVAAQDMARRMADALGYVGVMAVEFFATADGPIVNELAPRVHNSGHWTIEGAVTSQFENHIRAIAGQPLGSTATVAAPVVMRNLIGDAVNRWPDLLADPDCHLHLYGKGEARPGRKMGHATWVGTEPRDAAL